jgi:hypothetical protein
VPPTNQSVCRTHDGKKITKLNTISKGTKKDISIISDLKITKKKITNKLV